MSVLADDVTLKAAAAIILQAMRANDGQGAPILDDAWNAAHEAHSEKDNGNASDVAEAFIDALANVIV